MNWLLHLCLVIAALLGVSLGTVIQSPLRDRVLPFYPRGAHALEALSSFKKLDEQIMVDNKPRAVSVLKIDDPSWRVIFDFIQSEIAIQKSSRDDRLLTRTDTSPESGSDPGNQQPPPPTATPGAEATPGGIKQDTPRERLSPISFNRVKTITCIHLTPLRAGRTPLTPEYALLVWSPPNIARSVYEFLSFDEFRNDLGGMVVGELMLYSGLLAAIPLCAEIVIILVGRRRSQRSVVSAP